MLPEKGIDYLSYDEMPLQKSYLDELSMRIEELSQELCDYCEVKY